MHYRRRTRFVGAIIATIVAVGVYLIDFPFFTNPLLAGIVTYGIVVFVIAWISRTRHWYHRSTRGHKRWECNCTGKCGVSNTRYRLGGDWIPKCHRCGWKAGWPLTRWLIYSVPARQFRRTLNLPKLAAFLITVGFLTYAGGAIAGGNPGAVLQSGSDDGTSVTVNDTMAAADEWFSINKTQLRQALHKEINERRSQRGLPPLEYSPELEEVAQYHSKQMAQQGFFGHTAPSGQTMEDRYARFGITCSSSAENIHRTTATAKDERKLAERIVESWMGSPEHRKNILGPHSVEGFGIAVGTYEGNENVMVTQNFC